MNKRLSQFEPGEKTTTKTKIITLTDVETFANMTRNALPLFLDEKCAQSLGWRTRLVPGPLTFSCAIGLMEDAGLLDDVMAFMASDKIRFTAPVYPYDSLTIQVELISKKLTKDRTRGLVNYRWVGKNQEDKTIIEGENTCMFKVR